MATTMFQPADGDRARWRKAYDTLLAEGVDYGKAFTHEFLAGLFGLAVQDFLRSRQPLYRVIQELEREHGRTLVPIPGQGYRVSTPPEHASLVMDRRRRSRRLMTRGMDLIKATDTEGMTAVERRELDKVKGMLVVCLGTLTCHEARLNRIEEILAKNGML